MSRKKARSKVPSSSDSKKRITRFKKAFKALKNPERADFLREGRVRKRTRYGKANQPVEKVRARKSRERYASRFGRLANQDEQGSERGVYYRTSAETRSGRGIDYERFAVSFSQRFLRFAKQYGVKAGQADIIFVVKSGNEKFSVPVATDVLFAQGGNLVRYFSKVLYAEFAQYLREREQVTVGSVRHVRALRVSVLGEQVYLNRGREKEEWVVPFPKGELMPWGKHDFEEVSLVAVMYELYRVQPK